MVSIGAVVEHVEVQKLLSDLYERVSGFQVGSNEYQMIREKGGDPTYGELTLGGMNTLVEELKLQKNDVFYDLGSGVGKMPVYIYLTTPVKKAVGIELSPTRHAHAIKVKKSLEKKGMLDSARALNFLEKSMLDENLSDATIIYMSSTCFSDELMKSITDKLTRENTNPLKILTLKKLPDNTVFQLTKTLSLPMTWSDNVRAYLYERSA